MTMAGFVLVAMRNVLPATLWLCGKENCSKAGRHHGGNQGTRRGIYIGTKDRGLTQAYVGAKKVR